MTEKRFKRHKAVVEAAGPLVPNSGAAGRVSGDHSPRGFVILWTDLNFSPKLWLGKNRGGSLLQAQPLLGAVPHRGALSQKVGRHINKSRWPQTSAGFLWKL